MARLDFHKVTTLPGTPAANSFYFVENGQYAESYVTDDAGVTKAIGNTDMIEAVATSVFNDLSASEVQMAADIAARDALVLDVNSLVLVQDASGDATVDSGSALYFYNAGADSFTKVAEYESLDLVIEWADIQNKPTSAVADIDNAVTLRHSHANKALLDTYTQTNADLADAVGKKHDHANKALLDTYTQTEANLADAVAKKHAHANLVNLDKIGENGTGQLTYDGVAYKTWDSNDW